jgi:nitrogen regulatory protein PII
MRMLLIIYSAAADDDVVTALKKAGVKAYTKTQEAYGEGSETEPKLGTHYWPGRNNILFIAADKDEIDVITETLSMLKREHPKTGIRVFILPVEEQIL